MIFCVEIYNLFILGTLLLKSLIESFAKFNNEIHFSIEFVLLQP
jgi:hypothetical protein